MPNFQGWFDAEAKLVLLTDPCVVCPQMGLTDDGFTNTGRVSRALLALVLQAQPPWHAGLCGRGAKIYLVSRNDLPPQVVCPVCKWVFCMKACIDQCCIP